MIESPLVQELVDELKVGWMRDAVIKDVIEVLVARFGGKAQALEAELKAIDEETRLRELIKHAATCRTLSLFRKHLSARN